MGQRLNIEIVDNDGVIANSYYHWSAYTGSAIALTRHILDRYEEYKAKYHDRLELAVRLLESTGAGVNEKELEDIKKYPELSKLEIQKAQNRNKGLLSVTPEGITETENWEEGRVTIDLDSESVIFSVFFHDGKDEYLEYSADDGISDYENLPVIDFDPGNELNFKDFEHLEEVYQKSAFSYRLPNGNVINWIE